MEKDLHQEFWVDLPETAASGLNAKQQTGGKARSRLPKGAKLTQPEFPGDPPQPGYTLPPSPLMVHSPADPQGSWTGVPEQHSETPLQDADDL